jgi:hypothetical protein
MALEAKKMLPQKQEKNMCAEACVCRGGGGLVVGDHRSVLMCSVPFLSIKQNVRSNAKDGRRQNRTCLKIFMAFYSCLSNILGIFA